MVSPSGAAVVLVRFPFSDLSQTKLRPALVLADSGRGDWILCQITSNPYGDPRAVPLAEADFQSGALRAPSYARPGKLFTASGEPDLPELLERVARGRDLYLRWGRDTVGWAIYVFRHRLPQRATSAA